MSDGPERTEEQNAPREGRVIEGESGPTRATLPAGREGSAVKAKRKHHSHVLFAHFPIALFGTSFLFQILHFFWRPVCFELATNVALIGGTVTMLPTVWTGFLSWRHKYHSSQAKVFNRKIIVGVAMLVAGIVFSLWRSFFNALGEELPYLQHIIYAILITTLLFGAFVEGYYGGRLTHK